MIHKYTYQIIEAKDMALGEERYILKTITHSFEGHPLDVQHLIFDTKKEAEKFGKLIVGLQEDIERDVLMQVKEKTKKELKDEQTIS